MRLQFTIVSVLVLIASCSQKTDSKIFGVEIGEKINLSEYEVIKSEEAKPFKTWLYGNSYIKYDVKTVPQPEESFDEYTISATKSGIVFGVYATKRWPKENKEECMNIYHAYRNKFKEWFGSETELTPESHGKGYVASDWIFSEKPISKLSISCYEDSVSVSLQNYKLNF